MGSVNPNSSRVFSRCVSKRALPLVNLAALSLASPPTEAQIRENERRELIRVGELRIAAMRAERKAKQERLREGRRERKRAKRKG